MKKAIGILATAIMMLTFTACGQTETSLQTSIYQQSSTSTAINGTSNSTDGASEPNEQNSSEPVAESTDNSQESTDSTQQSTNSSSESLPEEQEPSAEDKTLIPHLSLQREKMVHFISENIIREYAVQTIDSFFR